MFDNPVADVKPPKIAPDIDAILSLRGRVAEVLRGWEKETPLCLADLTELLTVLSPCLPTPRAVTWHQFFLPYFGHKLKEQGEGLAWRIAGNAGLLNRQICPPLWSAGEAPAYVAGVVVGSEPSRTFTRKPQTVYRVRLVSGAPAGTVGQLTFPTAGVYVVAKRVGFSSERGNLPIRHTAEMVGLRLLCLVRGQRVDGTPQLTDVTVPPRYLAYNREVIKLRRRIHPCPHEFNHECTDCPIAFTACVGSVHRLEWYLAECPRCRVERVFDPELGDRICRACWYQERLA